MKIRAMRLSGILLVLILLAAGCAVHAESGYVWEQPVPYSLETELAVEEKVAELTAQCRASGALDDYEVALWLHDWLIYNADYDLNNPEYGADGVLLKGRGVCESYTRAFGLLLDEMGIEHKQVRSEYMDHTWNLVRLEGEWYHIDCTWDDPEGGDGENHAYFGLSDALIGRDHVWDDASSLPACTFTDCFYYLRSGGAEIVSSQEELNEAISRSLAAGKTTIDLYNISVDGVDTWDGITTWANAESCRYPGIGYGYGGTEFMVTLDIIGYNPYRSTIEYMDQAQFTQDVEQALQARAAEIYVYDRTGADTFDYEALFRNARKAVNTYAAAHSCTVENGFGYSDSGRFVVLYVTYSTELVLPDALTVIEDQAFMGSGAGHIVLPDGCTAIGERAFADCAELLTVYMPDSVQTIADSAFSGSPYVSFICESYNAAARYADAHDIGYTIG